MKSFVRCPLEELFLRVDGLAASVVISGEGDDVVDCVESNCVEPTWVESNWVESNWVEPNSKSNGEDDRGNRRSDVRFCAGRGGCRDRTGVGPLPGGVGVSEIAERASRCSCG